MRTWTLLAALLPAGLVGEAQANGPRPAPPPNTIQIGARAVELAVEVDSTAKEARLIIPAGLLTAGRPRLGADAGNGATLIAGLALSCAFVSGGFWVVRRRRGRGIAGVLVVVSLLAVGTSGVFADIAIGPRPRRPEQPQAVTLPATVQITGKLVLEVAPGGDKVRLVVNKTMLPGAGAVKAPAEKE